jgi:hypothetical protein
MKNINLSARYLELQKEISTSEVGKIKEIENNLGVSLFILKNNFNELKQAIDSYYSDKLAEWASENHKKYDEFLWEFQRYLHNFLASAFSLVEHSTVFRKKLNNRVFNDFYEILLKEMLLNKCVGFIKDLRVYSQHYKLPLTASARCTHLISLEGELMVSSKNSKKMFGGQLAFLKTELEKWECWSKDSKEFISKYQCYVDSELVTGVIFVRDIIETYCSLIKKFYANIYDKIHELYALPFEEYDKLHREIYHIIRLMEKE